MPTYDFACDNEKCQRMHTRFMGMNEVHESTCPSCGAHAHWKPTTRFEFKFTFKDGYDVSTGVYHPTKKHYEDHLRQKGLVKVE